ncbi:Holliday junction resolvase RecU [Mesoplasma sp. JKS002658]|uniref:Holliday junction resolvase RecU n=1 Tax=Mesoplasma whartonense TaxID=2878854 RepID=UPI002022AD41|nr:MULTISPECIES: Holliday junction resolvase RecU [unclassified Mesoplasma]MCL8211276.1 Holliday junction resolvase RecU [Mesoplasma sp. JKS002664]MCL8212129.1 Holliday junction resolvase RecU [Mesoplasma sp. JKS002662]MCL8212607.1 Holliday junction resolvase RecU [Mesoplasma sp. JKS002661]MCL8213271.1 Holliday junction resolvase RecU [Mesoplasma sp. JKS002660]MCL8214342.1 Holliday junction resolvase RecU [Mesoplasma sp. JKS002658]
MLPLKNKGLFLEEILNLTHNHYLQTNQALVNKIPTNIKMFKKTGDIIHQAVFSPGSNCDYVGIYHGVYLEFEAKETYDSVFKYQNLRKNQINELDQVINHRGLAFVIIYFDIVEKFFLIDWRVLKTHFSKTKKTIPWEWFTQFGHELKLDHHLCLDYLPALNYLINCI